MSDANRSKLLYAAETSFAETPDLASTLQEIRFVSESLEHAKETVVSEEIRSDRARSDLIEVGKAISGEVSTELVLAAYNDLILAALLASAWTQGQDTGLTLTTDGTANTITATVGTFSAATQLAKQIKFGGFVNASNNAVFTVISCTSTVCTVAPGQLVVADDETAVAACTADYNYARNGVSLSSFLFEKQFLSLTVPEYMGFTGCVINEWGLTMGPRARVLQSFGILGAQALSATATYGDGSPVAPNANPILNSTANIQTILLDGAAAAVNVMNIEFALNNNLRDRPAIARAYTLEHGKGTIDLTGTLETYFEDGTMLDKFLLHSSSDILIPFRDADGNGMSLHMPEVKFSSGSPMVDGVNTDVVIPLEYQAILDATLGYVIQVDQLEA
jgi:hypothetical protein